jgi:hypothetical protein
MENERHDVGQTLLPVLYYATYVRSNMSMSHLTRTKRLNNGFSCYTSFDTTKKYLGTNTEHCTNSDPSDK